MTNDALANGCNDSTWKGIEFLFSKSKLYQFFHPEIMVAVCKSKDIQLTKLSLIWIAFK